MVSVAGALTYANAAFFKLLGHDPAAVETLQLDSLTDPMTAAELRARSGLEAAGTGIDCRFIRKDGSRIWVHALTSTALTPTEPSLLLQLIDIDQRKQAEAALARSESRLAFALEAATQGVWDHDITTDTTYYSPSWRSMRGIPPDEPIDGTYAGWRSRIHPEDRDAVVPMAEKRDAGERGFRIAEYRERHRDGHLIWIQNRGRTVEWDENGKATRTLGTDTDITAHKLAESRVKDISDRLELALNASGIGVWERDTGTAMTSWDHRMYEIYGGDNIGDLQGSGWEDVLHPEDRDAAILDISNALAAKGYYLSQFRIIWPNGEVRHIRSRAQVFQHPGAAARIVGAEWDVTADVKRNDELVRARALAESRLAALKRAQADLEHAALHDYLTDLPNRRYLHQTMTERRALAKRRNEGQAVLHIDLDHFKEINDTFGHAAGDTMLRHVANLLRANVREGDFIARIGGDEFVVLCGGDGSVDDLTAMADRILRELSRPVPYEGKSMAVGASIGIALERAGEVTTRRLLHEADIAMYRAKTAGRNRYELSMH